MEGFIPISEIDWERIKHPSEILKKDNEYELKIINIDKEKLQITLSRKRLQDDPWLKIKKKYPVGALVEGKIVNLTRFWRVYKPGKKCRWIGTIVRNITQKNRQSKGCTNSGEMMY